MAQNYANFCGKFGQPNVLKIGNVLDEVLEVVDVGVVKLHERIELLYGLGQAIPMHHLQQVGEVVAAVEHYPLHSRVQHDSCISLYRTGRN